MEKDNRIKELTNLLQQKEKTTSLLAHAKNKLFVLKQDAQHLNEIMLKEKKDVENLEGLSLTGMFYSLLGDKEDRLRKENQEYLAAKLKYESCIHSIKFIEADVLAYEQQLKKFPEIEKELNELLAEKEKLFAGKADSKINELNNKIQGYENQLKELKEAVNAGENIIPHISQAEDLLNSAGNWGVFDMLGGGIIATAVKHSKVDDARSIIQHIQMMLHRFNNELADVKVLSVSAEINFSGFEKFADYFFDNLITDWMVQSKIKNSLNSVISLRNEITGIINKLDDKKDELNKLIAGIQKEKTDYLSKN